MLPGVEGGCSHVAMSSGEHEDEHEEVLSGVAAMASAWIEHRRRAEMARLLRISSHHRSSSVNVYMH